MNLGEREYLTAAQAAKLFGHGQSFWRAAFDAGHVTGYRYGRRGDRHISAASIRGYLARLGAGIRPTSHPDLREANRRRMAAWREKMAAQGANQGSQKPNNEEIVA